MKKLNKLYVIYELLMFSAALISVAFIWNDTTIWMNHLVWFIFFIDVSTRFILTKDKLAYIKKNPFDIIAIIPLDSIFQLARLVRLIRILRFAAIAQKYAKPVVEILKTNGLHKVIIFTSILIFVCAIPITIAEPSMETYADGLWWSVVTATTVGYGDISPVTGIGRIIAIILMIFGIGLIGMVTGSIATYFLIGSEEKNSTIQYIQNELNHFETLSNEEIDRIIYLIESMKKDKGIS
ncbi:potassium channel family protein [Anaerobacillus sp. MEB173]|uniref:potassium channel family protein n=1 Tax=Anaerobacillus sp. MEB173 TaxID=3383345 RepID=UPI003F92B8D1